MSFISYPGPSFRGHHRSCALSVDDVFNLSSHHDSAKIFREDLAGFAHVGSIKFWNVFASVHLLENHRAIKKHTRRGLLCKKNCLLDVDIRD
jgi:hypothetical protein